MSILILCDHDNGQLSPVTLNTVTAAKQIGGDIDILVAGAANSNVARATASIAGVNKVLTADDKVFENDLAENLAPLLHSLSANYSHIMAPATTTGKNVMPRLAEVEISQPALLPFGQHQRCVARRSRHPFARFVACIL